MCAVHVTASCENVLKKTHPCCVYSFRVYMHARSMHTLTACTHTNTSHTHIAYTFNAYSMGHGCVIASRRQNQQKNIIEYNDIWRVPLTIECYGFFFFSSSSFSLLSHSVGYAMHACSTRMHAYGFCCIFVRVCLFARSFVHSFVASWMFMRSNDLVYLNRKMLRIGIN